MRVTLPPARAIAALLPVVAVLAVVGTGVSGAQAGAGTPDAQGWRPLFDGRTMKGWRGYKGAAVSAGWQAVDGALVRQAGGGDIVTDEEFEDFELAIEWKVGKAGNSGIFYRVDERAEIIWHHAPEYQVLDNAGHRDGKSPLTSAGSCYAVYPPARDVTRPAGEWNATRILSRGNHVEHWLNGTKVAEFEIGSEEWNARVAASKFKQYPEFGKARRGRIGLQDHGDVVSYRNIRIRPLP